VKPRAVQAGVLLFQPTLAERVKIAAGFNIRVRIEQMFQHHPGKIEVAARWELVEQSVDESTPTIRPIEERGAS
jgi:hypothetical protein